MPRVAVITDVVEPDFFFPLWHKYYAGFFGTQNLFAVTYADSRPIPPEYKLGGVVRLPAKYNDPLRARFISGFNNTLLEHYDVVVRVDVDEILVPDPRKFTNLVDYMDSNQDFHVTAWGIDLIQGADEGVLDVDRPILIEQRRYAYPNSSLNKTCVTSIKTHWLTGFHYCNHYPNFGDLLLVHLKRADVAQQIRWAGEMLKATPNDANLARYYATDEGPILKYRSDVLSRHKFKGWDGIPRPDYYKRVIDSYKLVRVEGKQFYSGKHFHDDILVELPEELAGKF